MYYIFHEFKRLILTFLQYHCKFNSWITKSQNQSTFNYFAMYISNICNVIKNIVLLSQNYWCDIINRKPRALSQMSLPRITSQWSGKVMNSYSIRFVYNLPIKTNHNIETSTLTIIQLHISKPRKPLTQVRELTISANTNFLFGSRSNDSTTESSTFSTHAPYTPKNHTILQKLVSIWSKFTTNLNYNY